MHRKGTDLQGTYVWDWDQPGPTPFISLVSPVTRRHDSGRLCNGVKRPAKQQIFLFAIEEQRTQTQTGTLSPRSLLGSNPTRPPHSVAVGTAVSQKENSL